MRVGGVPYRAIFAEGSDRQVRVIDKTRLPHRFETIRLTSPADAARAIRDMVVRGAGIPIEERDPTEVTRVWGVDEDGVERWVRVVPEGTRAANYAFDVTPRRLVTGLVTERGVCAADHGQGHKPDSHAAGPHPPLEKRAGRPTHQLARRNALERLGPNQILDVPGNRGFDVVEGSIADHDARDAQRDQQEKAQIDLGPLAANAEARKRRFLDCVLQLEVGILMCGRGVTFCPVHSGVASSRSAASNRSGAKMDSTRFRSNPHRRSIGRFRPTVADNSC